MERTIPLQEANDRLYDIFKNHDFSHITHTERTKLAEFYQLVAKEQSKQNFTRLMKFRDFAIKHYIDCLIVSKLVDLKFPLLDIGTGPGFPGIPLKILHPNEKIYLAEGVQKRVEFLKSARENLQLQELGIFGRNINNSFVYPVQGVITRAVEEIDNTLKNCIHSLQTGGEIYFMKGPKVGEEQNRISEEMKIYYKLEKDIEYQLPKTPHKRRLLVYKKIKSPDLKSMEWFMDRDYEAENELKNREF